jgi:hypothetical protein
MPNFKPSRIRGSVSVDSTTPVTIEGISVTTFFFEDSVTGVTPSPTESTILTQAFVLTTFENLVLVEVSGTNYAKYRLKVNGAILATKRTGPNLNVNFDFTGAPYALTVGDVVTVTVEHFNAGTEDFEATVFGYE